MTKKIIIFVILLALGIGLTFFLNRVFSGHLILPQTFSLGPLTLHYYGLTMAAAVGAELLDEPPQAPAARTRITARMVRMNDARLMVVPLCGPAWRQP